MRRSYVFFRVLLLCISMAGVTACGLFGDDSVGSSSCTGGDCDAEAEVFDEAPPECSDGTHWSSLLNQCVPDNVTPADEDNGEEADEEEFASEIDGSEPELEEFAAEIEFDEEEIPTETEIEEEPEWDADPDPDPEPEIDEIQELEEDVPAELDPEPEWEPELEPDLDPEPEWEPELEPELEPEPEIEEDVPTATIEGDIYLFPWHRQEMIEVFLDDTARETVGPVLTLGPADDAEFLSYNFSMPRGRYWIHARLRDSPDVTGRFLGNSATEGEDSVYVDPNNPIYNHFDGLDFLLGENGSCDVTRVAQAAGNVCNSGADCEQNACLSGELEGETIRFCSQFCDGVSCPEGWSCATEDPLGQVCRPNDAAQSVVWGGNRGFGETCNEDDDCAAEFACDKSRDDWWLCSYPCTANEVCGQCGYCDSGICRPQHSPGAFGDFCHDETDCAGGVHYCVADMCTMRCFDLPGTQGSCPDGTLCLVYIQNVAQLCLPEDWEAR